MIGIGVVKKAQQTHVLDSARQPLVEEEIKQNAL
jgi:hypothetical protein